MAPAGSGSGDLAHSGGDLICDGIAADGTAGRNGGTRHVKAGFLILNSIPCQGTNMPRFKIIIIKPGRRSREPKILLWGLACAGRCPAWGCLVGMSSQRVTAGSETCIWSCAVIEKGENVFPVTLQPKDASCPCCNQPGQGSRKENCVLKCTKQQLPSLCPASVMPRDGHCAWHAGNEWWHRVGREVPLPACAQDQRCHGKSWSQGQLMWRELSVLQGWAPWRDLSVSQGWLSPAVPWDSQGSGVTPAVPGSG